MTRRAIFLDRDGVINRAIVRDGKPYPPASLQEVEILPGVDEALRRLKDADYVLVVVSNQPDVARGTTCRSTVEGINDYLKQRLPIDRFIMCYHDSGDGCACRKPRPGMLQMGAEEFGINMGESFMVGDRWRDVAAGVAAGCQTLYIDYGYNEQQPARVDFSVGSLLDAADIILGVKK